MAEAAEESAAFVADVIRPLLCVKETRTLSFRGRYRAVVASRVSVDGWTKLQKDWLLAARAGKLAPLRSLRCAVHKLHPDTAARRAENRLFFTGSGGSHGLRKGKAGPAIRNKQRLRSGAVRFRATAALSLSGTR
jgi:hypothetical protein